jgi:NhaA family Na+:H+ antiporter
VKEKLRTIAAHLHPRHINAFLETFLKDESLGGKLILVAAVISLAIVNSPLREAFDYFWHIPLSIGLDTWNISLDLRHWVNEALMGFFFLVVGLEIKRELSHGELKNIKTAVLPIGAAVGGMIVPAVIYLAFNMSSNAVQGWGIPIATDIAFAVAVLSLLSDRIPISLKIFLLTLAIADDIGAIIVIALFYAEIINYWYLAISFVLAGGMFILRRYLTYRLLLVVGLGIVLWVTTHLSGIHASIVGAVIGLLLPATTHLAKVPVSEQFEKMFLPVTTFVILPLFAFANAGFPLTTDALTSNQSVFWGIFLGLVVGKLVGITFASWLLVKLGVASLPSGVSWIQIMGIGFIAGIGFTVSIFITELAFADNQLLTNTAKMAIFIASATSALIGYALLRTAKPQE